MTRAQKLRKKRKNDRWFRITSNLNRRLRKEVEREFRLYRGIRFNSAGFLYWLANRQKIKDRTKFHIDHIVPTVFYKNVNISDSIINNPLNLRWLSAKKNCRKNRSMPKIKEIEEHKELVKMWESEYLDNCKNLLDYYGK